MSRAKKRKIGKKTSQRKVRGVKKWKNAKKTQPEESKWCEKPENREKYPIGEKRAGQKGGK